MKTYITEKTKKDGKLYAGPRIEAKSWESAERKSRRRKVVLVGEVE